MDMSQMQNEYIVTKMTDKEKKGHIIDVINTEDKNYYITPAVHKLLSLFEQLGVEEIKEVEGSPNAVFMDNDFYKNLKKSVGKKYLLSHIRDLYELLNQFGIKAFKRNVRNSKWRKNFEVTDKKLAKYLESSQK